MPTPSAVMVLKGRARKNEIEDALINPSVALASNVLLSNRNGGKAYLSVYRSAMQSAGGSSAFAPSVTDDGTITFFMESVPPPELAGQAGSASPASASPVFALVINASGPGTRYSLTETNEGGAISRLATRLYATDLKQVKAALFDANPNVAIEVTQTVRLASQQTQDFVKTNWSNPAIRQGLLDLFGVPYDSAAMYSMMASGADPDFPNQYLVLSCVYKTQVAAPPLPGFVQWQVSWENRAYNYYQDNQDRARVFYLPDRFEFAKGPAGAPSVSLLQFTLPEGPATVERTRATFRLYGSPVVNFNRVENAAQILKDRVGGKPEMVSLQDARSAKMSFTQYLPNAQVTGSDPAVQPKAQIDLVAGLRNELNLNFNQFRALWAAIFSSDPQNPLFRGWVDVELSDGKFRDRIDFDGRIAKHRETPFFDDILDTTTQSTYPAKFTVETVKKVFASGDPAPVEIDLTFAGGKTVMLDPSNLQAQVQVERSIRDIVLGNQSPDEHPYIMRVIRDDGKMACCEGKAKSDTPKVWITVDQIAQCTGGCS